MRKNYVKVNSKWQALISLLDVGSWKFLEGMKSLALSNMHKHAQDYWIWHYSFLWYDPWPLGQWEECDSKVIHNGQWQLIISEVTEIWTQIVNVPITGNEDARR